MSIIPDSDETLIVDQTAVNGNGNGYPTEEEPEDVGSEPELDEDWGDIRRPPEVPARWQDIGFYVAENHLKGRVVVRRDPASNADLTWQLHEDRLFVLTPKDRGPVAEDLLLRQYDIADELRASGSKKAGDKVAQAGFADQVRGAITPLWAGINFILRCQPYEDPPGHLLNTPAGVRDLRERRTHPLKEVPYLFTSCTAGSFADGAGAVAAARALVDARLSPALPEARDREHLLRAWAQAVGGEAGGLFLGSVLYLTGSSGGGKGNALRFAEDSLGGYCMPIECDSLLTKAPISAERADVLEANPRMLTMSEVTSVAMPKLLRVTGRDTLTARNPYKRTVRRRLECAVNISSVHVPRGRADTGLRRRLFAIAFRQVAAVTADTATDFTDPAFRDALVTVLVDMAQDMLSQGDDWPRLPADDPFTAECLRQSDPVSELAEGLTPEDHGRKLSGLTAELKHQGCNPPPRAAVGGPPDRGVGCPSRTLRRRRPSDPDLLGWTCGRCGGGLRTVLHAVLHAVPYTVPHGAPYPRGFRAQKSAISPNRARRARCDE